ncbi:hypothetical protein PTI98_007896 [Pleurotus ostreatus]|nr:hypothetical protein PTI98_007896 [Pleurotus ostreatus]
MVGGMVMKLMIERALALMPGLCDGCGWRYDFPPLVSLRPHYYVLGPAPSLSQRLLQWRRAQIEQHQHVNPLFEDKRLELSYSRRKRHGNSVQSSFWVLTNHLSGLNSFQLVRRLTHFNRSIIHLQPLAVLLDPQSL